VNYWILSEKCRKADIWWWYGLGDVGFGGSGCIPGYIKKYAHSLKRASLF